MTEATNPNRPRPKFDWEVCKQELSLAAKRLVFCDFSHDHATASEADALRQAKEPVVEPYAQAYAGWRRSLLWVAGSCLVVAGIFKCVGFRSLESQLEELAKGDPNMAGVSAAIGKQNLETIDGLMLLLLVPTLIAGGLALWGAWHWNNVRRSRRAARVSFAILFFAPLLLALVPLRDMLEFPNLDEAKAEQLRNALGVLMGATYFVHVAPRVFSAFPGLMRASMTVKTLIPMSPFPAWVTVMIAPLYAIFFALLMAMVAQVNSEEALLAGLGCLLLSPLIYLWKAPILLRAYTRPLSDDETRKARLLAMAFAGGGIALIAGWLIQQETFGVIQALEFIFAMAGSYVLINVAGADLMVALMYYGHEQAKAFATGPFLGEFEQRIDQMHGVGFTNLSTRSPRPPATKSEPAASGPA